MKSIKVKTIAQRYDVSEAEIYDELESQGFSISKKSGEIPADVAELIEEFFEDLFANKKAFAQAKKHRKNAEELVIDSPVIVKNLAEALNKKPNVIISDLMKLGELASINQAISDATAKKLCKNYGIELVIANEKVVREPKKNHVTAKTEVSKFDVEEADDEKDLLERPPVVTFLGHVDHGKTSLQDAVRKTNIVAGESGRITQHIGASTITYNDKMITFIDTPGHAAFTSMRARGANATDIAILVVSASEGFKAQTVEAMNHALAAKVPIIVAMNKIDLPDADPNKVLLQMQQNNLMSEDWGGEVGTVKVSAKTGEGLNDLLDRILLEAEILELKANPKAKARGIVLESNMEFGLGAAASVLVQKGTLKVGDPILCGTTYGKVKTMIDDKGKRVKVAPPSTPVKIIGLNAVPEAGDKLIVCDNEKEARLEAERRIAEKRNSQQASSSITSAEDLFSKLNSSSIETLDIIIKSDVRGSGEAIAQSLEKIPSDKVKCNVVANSVGAISENDVMLAAASNAILVGFHVRVNPGVNDLAKRQGVEIRLYNIIYELLEDITDALAGKLEPEKREVSLGEAKILQIFNLSKGGKICGCMVESGAVKVGSKARVFRNNELIYNGEVASLKRFQDNVKEVKAGLECGIKLDNFVDFEEGDLIEIFEIELKKATL
ncbi:MAG: translation initiation factor IF-2 [Lentisphaeria bacterium]|nr:translation initiation factor IF-2 [Lentisphaeria bacterium]